MKENVNKKKKVCFIHVGMERDGAERVIARLANNYAEQGYKVDILMILLNICEYELHESIRVISYARPEKTRFQNIYYWLKSIRKYVKENKPDRIISFSMYINIFTLIACLGLKKDILISERNDPSNDGRSKIDIILTKCLYRYADKIVFQTKRAQNFFSDSIKKNSKIIYNPIEVTCHATLDKKNKIVTVGRLEKQKNQKLLIEAFSKIKDKEIVLEIYGKGSLKEELYQYAVKLNIADRVLFKGNVFNIHECIKDAKVFVLSSDFEGLSNALLEAMMMGIPCISTKCAGSDEVIQDGKNGLLVELRDVESLTIAIDKIIKNFELSKFLGENARKTSVAFKSSNVIKEWIDYIDL